MRAKSHVYEFAVRDLLAIIGLPLVPVGLFALFMHAGAAGHILPKPRPILDTDRTILFHQADASRKRHAANLVLIGDSSCLMDVSAPQLTRGSNGMFSALNLGTLSYLDLNAFATMLTHYEQTNSGQVDLVVLFMNLEALRRPSPADYNVEALRHYYAGADYCGPALPPVLCTLGVEIFRGRLLSRMVPRPLPGSFGRDYGFTRNLWNYLSMNGGSAVDPGQFNPATASGNAEYRLASSLEAASKVFRARVPAGAELCIGITPLPESFVPGAHAQVHQRLLNVWNAWIQADLMLAELPATLPDHLFASTTHLNAEGIKLYTDQLGRALARHRSQPKNKPLNER